MEIVEDDGDFILLWINPQLKVAVLMSAIALFTSNVAMIPDSNLFPYIFDHKYGTLLFD